MRGVVHYLLGLLLLPAVSAAPASASTSEEATQAVHRFIEAWNIREPAAFAATLQYPHVRPTADFEGVNLAITGTRYGPGGTRIHSFDAIYLITEQDGRWGIRAGSGMSPRR